MLQPHASVNWALLGQSLYNWWALGAGIFAFSAFLFRSKIGRWWRLFVDSLRSAKAQSLKIAALSAQRDKAIERGDDWQARFTEIESRLDALNTESQRLRDDMIKIRKRMTTAEDLNHMLRRDRDNLIDFSRLLIGQISFAGMKPDYQPPSLESIIVVPGPPLTVPGPPLPPIGPP